MGDGPPARASDWVRRKVKKTLFHPLGHVFPAEDYHFWVLEPPFPRAWGRWGARLPLHSAGAAAAAEVHTVLPSVSRVSFRGEMLDPVAAPVSAIASECVPGGHPW